MQSLWETYRERGFQVVAIESNRDTDRARKFIAQAGLGFTCLENGKGDAEVVDRVFRVSGYPTSFLVDRQGRVMYFHYGFEEGEEKEIEKELLTLL